MAAEYSAANFFGSALASCEYRFDNAAMYACSTGDAFGARVCALYKYVYAWANRSVLAGSL